MSKDIRSLQPCATRIAPLVNPAFTDGGSIRASLQREFRRPMPAQKLSRKRDRGESPAASQGAGDFFENESDRSAQALLGTDRLWDDWGLTSQQVSP
jgi:hypothetical protein